MVSHILSITDQIFYSPLTDWQVQIFIPVYSQSWTDDLWSVWWKGYAPCFTDKLTFHISVECQPFWNQHGIVTLSSQHFPSCRPFVHSQEFWGGAHSQCKNSSYSSARGSFLKLNHVLMVVFQFFFTDFSRLSESFNIWTHLLKDCQLSKMSDISKMNIPTLFYWLDH